MIPEPLAVIAGALALGVVVGAALLVARRRLPSRRAAAEEPELESAIRARIAWITGEEPYPVAPPAPAPALEPPPTLDDQARPGELPLEAPAWPSRRLRGGVIGGDVEYVVSPRRRLWRDTSVLLLVGIGLALVVSTIQTPAPDQSALGSPSATTSPTPTSTLAPTPTPTPKRTPATTPTPTPTPTPVPTPVPTPKPTLKPTPKPTRRPTPQPTARPKPTPAPPKPTPVLITPPPPP